ncbi:hypothetical protein DRQ09_01140 [candidate division KSB1 bacterium]|nr:MAG: hypothetical protein DRQ09_01140 [candidate division KSB1 bacterium]
MFITRFAIKRPVTTTMFFILLSLLGFFSFRQLPVQLFPNLIFPQIYVIATLPGASPEKIEKELIIPAEGEISTLKDIKKITSRVYPNYGIISVEYNPGSNMKYAYLKMQQKIGTIKANLPAGSFIEARRFDTSELSNFLMNLTIRGPGSTERLRRIAEKKVKPELEKIDGIVNVSIGGGDKKEVKIEIDEDKLQNYQIPLTRVISKINEFNKPKEFLGLVYDKDKTFFVTLEGRFSDVKQIKNLVIKPEIPLRLENIADIQIAFSKRTEYFRINGKSTVGIFLQKDDISNMIEVSDNVLDEIKKLNKELKVEEAEIVVNFNQAEMMKNAINRVEKLAVVGAFLALLVLLFFLKDLKTVFIILLAIPISLLVTFNLMFYGNLSLNILSLCGLALAIGMLVDNSIVVLENIFRHFEKGENAESASIKGCNEVSRSIFASTLTTIAVFTPVLYIESEIKIVMRELSLSVIFPLVISLLVAISLIPMLSSRILKKIKNKKFVNIIELKKRFLKRNRILEIYTVLLKTCIRHRGRTIVLTFVFFLLTLGATIPFLLTSEELKQKDSFDIFIETPKGSGLKYTDRIVRQVEEYLKEIDGIKEVRSRIREEDAICSVEFIEPKKRNKKIEIERVKVDLKKKTDRIKGANISYEKRTGTRGRGSVSEGEGNAVSGILGLGTKKEKIIIRGFNLEKLRFLTEDISTRLEDIEGIEGISNDLIKGSPEFQIRGDQKALSHYGITMSQIMQLIWIARREGHELTTPFKGKEEDLVIRTRLMEKKKYSLEELKNLSLPVPGKGIVPIKKVSRIVIDEGPRGIKRINQERQAEISYSFKKEIRSYKPLLEQKRYMVDRLIQSIKLPKGFSIEVQHETSQNKTFYWIIGASALLIVMILSSVFESFSTPWVIFGTIPLATIGAFWALLITGTGLTIMAWLGLLILLGIVVNNGIILIDYINILRYRKGFNRMRAVLYAGQARVRPIMMTAFTTVLGLLPLAFKTGEINEIWPPFAISVLGGLSVASIFTLIFIPVVYLSIDDVKIELKKIGYTGVLSILLLSTASFFYFRNRFNSLLWTILFTLAVVILLSIIIWRLITYIKRKKEKFVISEDIQIKISNLTKIYNLPSKIKRELKKGERKKERMIKSGYTDYGKVNYKESFTWKIPLFGFIIYLHFYFKSWFWITVLTILTYFMVFNLYRDIRNFVREKSIRLFLFRVEPGKRMRWILYRISVVIMFVYLYYRWESELWVSAVWCSVWFLGVYIKNVAVKVSRREINIDNVTGRFKKIRRLIYLLSYKVPFIGVKREEVTALHGVNLNIGKGMFGLLGPNGAGKTTLMRLICNIFEETRGSIYINGLKIKNNIDKIQPYIGYLPQEFGLYDNFTALDYLEYHAIINNIWDREKREKLIENILKGSNLWERRKSKLKTYSGGMKQRAGISKTLLHLPKIVVVDEPTAGLDPKERIRFRNILSEMSKDRIVIFSTHIVEDISTSCNQLAVLNKGKVIYNGTPEKMRKIAEGKVWITEINEKDFQYWNEKIKIVSHIKIKNKIRIRFISEEYIDELSPESVSPTLEDAYLLLLSRDKNERNSSSFKKAYMV